MATQIAVAFSDAPVVEDAAQHVCAEVKKQLGSAPADFVLLFSSLAYATAETVNTVHAVLKPQRLVGSAGSGVIMSDRVSPRGIGLLAVNSDEITFGICGTRPLPNSDLRVAGFDWGKKLHSDFKTHQHQVSLLFTDQCFQNNAQFFLGAQEVLGFSMPIVGGISCNDPRHKKSIQFFQKQVLNQSVVGLLIGANGIAFADKHGFKPLGKPRTITQASNNIIHKIEDKPAFHLYEEFLGPDALALDKKGVSPHTRLYPLGIYMEQQRQYVLKNAVDILSDGSIVCQGEVPQGAEVHLMIGNRDSCRNSAIEAAAQIKSALGTKQAKLLLVVDSFARYKILKSSAYIEVQSIRETLGYNAPIFGLYGSGEIVPVVNPDQGRSSMLIQNESILILAIY